MMFDSSGSDKIIVPLKLSDQVFQRLRDMISNGELSAGDPVPSERELMKRFGVGRPAVREALQTMKNKGLITINQGERSRVNTITAGIAFNQVDDIAKLLLSSEPSNIEHLKQVRHILELGTVKLAAERCTENDANELAELIAVQHSRLANAEDFMRADIAFHTRLALVSGNPLIHSITQMMLTWLFEYHSSLLLWSGREETTLQEHTDIVEYLRANNIKGAAVSMKNHLNRSNASFVSSAKRA